MANRQAECGGFQMQVARAGLEGLVQGRVQQTHDLARLAAERLDRQFRLILVVSDCN